MTTTPQDGRKPSQTPSRLYVIEARLETRDDFPADFDIHVPDDLRYLLKVARLVEKEHHLSPNIRWKPLGRCVCGVKQCPTLAALEAK